MSNIKKEAMAFPGPEYISGCGNVTPIEANGRVYFQENAPGMTIQMYAAIHLKVPDSGVEWLDEMIKKSRHHDAAEKALLEDTRRNAIAALKKFEAESLR